MSQYLNNMIRIAREVSLQDPAVGHDLEMNVRKIAIFGGPAKTRVPDASGYGAGFKGDRVRTNIFFQDAIKAIESFKDFLSVAADTLKYVKSELKLTLSDASAVSGIADANDIMWKPGTPVPEELQNLILTYCMPPDSEFARTLYRGKTASSKRIASAFRQANIKLAIFKGLRDKLKSLFTKQAPKAPDSPAAVMEKAPDLSVAKMEKEIQSLKSEFEPLDRMFMGFAKRYKEFGNSPTVKSLDKLISEVPSLNALIKTSVPKFLAKVKNFQTKDFSVTEEEWFGDDEEQLTQADFITELDEAKDKVKAANISANASYAEILEKLNKLLAPGMNAYDYMEEFKKSLEQYSRKMFTKYGTPEYNQGLEVLFASFGLPAKTVMAQLSRKIPSSPAVPSREPIDKLMSGRTRTLPGLGGPVVRGSSTQKNRVSSADYWWVRSANDDVEQLSQEDIIHDINTIDDAKEAVKSLSLPSNSAYEDAFKRIDTVLKNGGFDGGAKIFLNTMVDECVKYGKNNKNKPDYKETFADLVSSFGVPKKVYVSHFKRAPENILKLVPESFKFSSEKKSNRKRTVRVSSTDYWW